MEDSNAMEMPMSTTTTLDVEEEGEHVDQKEYQSMIGSLFYLTATRPDIQFSVSMCARFQASPRTSHRQAVKHIFRYLRHTPDVSLWYSTSSSLALHSFQMRILPDVGWIGSSHLGLASSWDLLWCLSLPANS
jgi:hypothetical protein